MEHCTRTKRIYLTSKSYLKKIRRTCLMLALLCAAVSGSIVFTQGVTFTSLGLIAAVGLISLLIIRFIWMNARCVSLKAGNIILKTMASQNVVAPIGSIREVRTSNFLGYNLTRIHYRIDGAMTKFFILTKSFSNTPEAIIKEEISQSRKRKKEANHKPDSVLTQIA